MKPKAGFRNWNYENQLSKSERTKGAEKRTVTFKYDPFGRRIEKKQVTTNPSTTETTTYVYDNEDIVLELTTDSTGTTKTFYTHGAGIDEPLAMERSGLFLLLPRRRPGQWSRLLRCCQNCGTKIQLQRVWATTTKRQTSGIVTSTPAGNTIKRPGSTTTGYGIFDPAEGLSCQKTR